MELPIATISHKPKPDAFADICDGDGRAPHGHERRSGGASMVGPVATCLMVQHDETRRTFIMQKHLVLSALAVVLIGTDSPCRIMK